MAAIGGGYGVGVRRVWSSYSRCQDRGRYLFSLLSGYLDTAASSILYIPPYTTNNLLYYHSRSLGPWGCVPLMNETKKRKKKRKKRKKILLYCAT